MAYLKTTKVVMAYFQLTLVKMTVASLKKGTQSTSCYFISFAELFAVS
jgi:hypothetical protein